MPPVSVEFFGLTRAKAGCPAWSLHAETPRQLLEQLMARFPALQDIYQKNRLSPSYLLSLDGERFLRDLDEPLPADARLLLLSADAGG